MNERMTFPQMRTCPVCGVEFECPNVRYGRLCRKCRGLARKRARKAGAPYDVRTTPEETLMRAGMCPKNTSAVRWRIELRRRARAEYYRDCCHVPEAF